MSKKAPFCHAMIFVLVTLFFASVANGQQPYPSKEILSVIPFPAGGGTDLSCRALGAVAQKYFGKTWVPINKVGSMGVIAAHYITQQEADGHSFAHLAPPPFTTVPYMFDVVFDPTLLKPVVGWAEYPFFIIVKADSPLKNLADLVAFARSNPGLKYSHSGPGNSTHLFMEAFAKKAGIKVTGVPFKGDADQSAALLGGHVVLSSGTTGFKPLVDAGKLRILGMFSKERVKGYEAPTVKEQGFDLGLYSPFMGIFVHKNTPEAVTKKIHDLTKKTVEDPEFLAAMDRIGMNAHYMPTQELADRLKIEMVSSQNLLRELGLMKKSKK